MNRTRQYVRTYQGQRAEGVSNSVRASRTPPCLGKPVRAHQGGGLDQEKYLDLAHRVIGGALAGQCAGMR